MSGRYSIWCLLVTTSLAGVSRLLVAEGGAALPPASQTPPAAQAPPVVQPIAFVDLDVVLDSPAMKRYKEAQARPLASASDKLSGTSVPREPDYSRLVVFVEALEEQLLAPELDPEKRAALTAEYIRLNRKLRSRIDVEKLRPSQQYAFKNELAAVIKRLALEHKISVVMYRTKNDRPPNEETQNLLRNPVVYTDPALDITPLVIEYLEKFQEKNAKPQP